MNDQQGNSLENVIAAITSRIEALAPGFGSFAITLERARHGSWSIVIGGTPSERFLVSDGVIQRFISASIAMQQNADNQPKFISEVLRDLRDVVANAQMGQVDIQSLRRNSGVVVVTLQRSMSRQLRLGRS